MSTTRSESLIDSKRDTEGLEEGDQASELFSKTDGDTEEVADSIKNCNPKEAWESLVESECLKVYISSEAQKQMEIEVGVNVTAEYPWKTIKFKIVASFLGDNLDEELTERLESLRPDDMLLIGYCEHLSSKDDMFLIFPPFDVTKRVCETIKNLEAHNRWTLDKIIYKEGRPWKGKESEETVIPTATKPRKDTVELELQSVYPLKHSSLNFSLALAGESRNRYVELLPGSTVYENELRKRIDSNIQSSGEKVDVAQQTDSTFPTSGWSQYFYEINREDEGYDPEEKKKGPTTMIFAGSRPASPQEPQPPGTPPPQTMSNQIKYLLSTLEFNQIDMYRNDYPLMATREIQKYTAASLKEVLCFANIAKSQNRYVCAIEEFLDPPGLIAVSYTFGTLATTTKDEDEDVVKRAVFEVNPILVWGVDDSLVIKLHMEASREVTCLKFCPYDKQILLGGMANGQIVLWDLEEDVAEIDKEEILSASRAKCRAKVRAHLSWAKPYNDPKVIEPIAISQLENSHFGRVVSIFWLSMQQYKALTGQVSETPAEKRYTFISCAIDGTISFWNLNATAIVAKDVKPNEIEAKVFNPQYTLTTPQRLTTLTFDWAEPQPQEDDSSPDTAPCHKLIGGSVKGLVHSFCLEKFKTEELELNKEEVTVSEDYDAIHDGPILFLETNPFIPDIFMSVGLTIFAIWKKNFFTSAIMWRKLEAPITAAKWSSRRPAVLLLGRKDGVFEAWDILAYTEKPVLSEMVSGGIITALSEHKLDDSRMVVGLGDFNSSFRMLELPEMLVKPVNNEKQLLQKYIDREEKRKIEFQEFNKNWAAKNEGFSEEEPLSGEMSQDEAELREDDPKAKGDTKSAKESGKSRRSPKPKKSLKFDLPEKLEKKWDDMNLRRLMKVLTSRKLLDTAKLEKQTALEKDAQNYNQSKRMALKKSFTSIHEEIAEIRSRLLPYEEDDVAHYEYIKRLAQELVDGSETYSEVEEAARKFLKENREDMSSTFEDFLKRGIERRAIIDKSLGANTERLHWYETLKKSPDWPKNELFAYGPFVDRIKKELNAKPSEEARENKETK